jgi:putative tricarboxylic transport membrane protein
VSSGMRRGWQLTGLVMFLICVATLWEARTLSLFDRLGPGSGFFPFYLSLIGAVLCGVIVVQVTRTPPRRSETVTIFPRGPIAWRAVAILACSALATILIDWLGFRLGVMIFSAALLPALGETRWWAVALFAVIAGFGLFYVFNNWLDVLLPVGVFGI